MAEEEDYDCGSFKPTKCARYSLFGVCLGVGLILVVTSIFEAMDDKNGAAIASVVIGNILVILSTGFLYGPKKLIASFKEIDRIFIAIGYLASIVLTIVAVVLDWDNFFLFIFLAAECVLMVFYILSYFPKIRECICGCCKKCCNRSETAG